MSKYDKLIKTYYRIARIIEPSIGYIPALQISEASSYYGSARVNRHTQQVEITLSYFRCGMDNRDNLIDTICHELAHCLVWEHGEAHDRLTEEFKMLAIRGLREAA